MLARREGVPVLITKGAFLKVREVCDRAETAAGAVVPLAAVEADLRERYAAWSAEGCRVPRAVSRTDVTGMTVLGLLALTDPLRPGVKATVAELARLGVRLKMITGHNALVAARVGREAGLRNPEVLTGTQMQQLSDSALPVRAEQVDVFAEIEPSQKERLIHALRRSGHVVGYLGGGRGPGGGRHRAAGSRPGRAAGGHPRGKAHLRQPGLDGGGVPGPALSAAAAQADPAHQSAHRSAGDDHRLRPGGS
ncbi:HAD family hydrolase [Synechococcus sp. BA-124 BA4]|uniref:HAD family hydrolase n=1 Tax=unclassified Synechococcus TaxID=2626047 RepID=UPI0018CD1379|nr:MULTISPECIES: HAD family hydrolase [unclassified Synechococcus]MEA5400440.1 HAD family hydrolase [Synechococcus sp. BA-124 BA4]